MSSWARRQARSYRIGMVLAAVVVLVTAYGSTQFDHGSTASARGSGRTVANPPATHAAKGATGQTQASALLPGGSKNWALTWEDGFSSSAGLNKWHYEVGNVGGKPLHELQWYDRKNASVAHGNLVMTATKNGGGHQCWNGPCRYSSVRMDTMGKFSQAYGVFEARIKVPQERGIWPAFWMEGANYNQVGLPAAGEIDVIEINGRSSLTHVGGYAHAPNLDFRAFTHLPKPLSSGYHVYGVEWTPKRISWMVDGKIFAHMNYYHGWAFNHPFVMLLSLAVGGSWPRPPTASTHFPARMYVDWVRVYHHV